MAPLGPIRFLTVHCSGSPARRGDTAANVCAWDIAKWKQKSYHWVIEENGKKVRCLADNEKGAHVALHNTGNIGVCYIGGIRAGGNPENPSDAMDTRTPEQKRALQEIVSIYKNEHPLLIVRGHRDWPGVHKLCPSFDVRTAL